MNGKMKVVIGTLLALAVLSVPFFSASTLAAVNGTETGNQVQDQDRIRIMDGSCDGDMFRTQTREKLGTQVFDCEQNRTRQRLEITNQSGNCNCEGNLEQCRHQYRAEGSEL